MDATTTTTTLVRMMSSNYNNVHHEPTREGTRATSYLYYSLRAILLLIIKLPLLLLSTAIAAVAFSKLAKRPSTDLSKLCVSLLHRCGTYLILNFIIIFLTLSFRYHKPLSGNNTSSSTATLLSPPPPPTTTAHDQPGGQIDHDEEKVIHVDPNSLLIEEFIHYNTQHEFFHSSSTEEEEGEGLPPPEEEPTTVETVTAEEIAVETLLEQENGIDGGGDLETTWRAISDLGQAPAVAMAAAAEQVVSESIPAPTPPLKKIQTLNVPAAAEAAARVRDFGVLECKRELRKSETFIMTMTTVEERRRRGRGGVIMRESDSLASHDKLTQRVEAFISKFQNQLRIQRQESDQRFLEMINRGL